MFWRAAVVDEGRGTFTLRTRRALRGGRVPGGRRYDKARRRYDKARRRYDKARRRYDRNLVT